MTAPMKVLAISPHADDVELGCAGTLLRWVKEQGAHVHVLTVSVKDEVQRHANRVVMREERLGELERAMQLLGASHEVLYGTSIPDPSHSSMAQLVQRLDAAIDRMQPDCVLLPAPSFHQDHKFVYEAGLAATRPTRYPSPIKMVATYEYPAAGWGDSADTSTMRGGMFVDISGYIEQKMQVIACHKSQCYRGENALISLEAVRALARWRGLQSGTQHAELLHVLRLHY